MRSSGSRDGHGSPPWGPAEPVPDLDDTQALPGLGTVPGPEFGATAWPNAGSGAGAGQDGTERNGSFGAQGTATPPVRDERRDSAEPQAPWQPDAGPRASGGKRPGFWRDLPAMLLAIFSRRQAGGKRRSFWRELPVLIMIALVLALVIKTYAIQAFFIPSASMENTLEIGDRVLINKVVYDLRPIHRGDIVVFDGTGSWDFNQPQGSSNIFSKAVDELEGIVGISHDSSIYIKRVIGLPGDRVACCNASHEVTVNGTPLTEGSYLFPGNSPSLTRFNITVPAGRLWVMGDHRAVSYDSRGHMGDPGGGTIPESGVLGRAFVIIWPPSRWGILNIPATFEQPRLNSSAAAAGGSAPALAAAMANGTPIRQAATPLPLALGFAGALPLTLLQRTARRRLTARRRARRQETGE